MKNRHHVLVLFLAAVIVSTGCEKKLDLLPTNDITAETVFSTAAGYKQAAAKFYASMVVEGNPTRDIPPEIVSDMGNTGFLRMYWYLQCLSTDEAGWTYFNNTDPVGIHQMTWSANTQVIAGLYYRCYYTIGVCNNFIQQSTDAKLSERGITGADATEIKALRAEAQFLRAYNYWVLLDNFGNVPFIDDSYVFGSGVLPKQIKAAELFKYVEDQLKAIDAGTDMKAARTNENGRADKGAVWALLARLYLNAKVYSGADRYTDAITYANKVIAAGYKLHPKYKELMLADNDLIAEKSAPAQEFIWTIRYDGTNTQTWSGTTFLVHGPSGVTGDSSGSNGTWNCMRITEQFVDKFASSDIRGQFWTSTQSKTMDVLLGDGTKGYSSSKFRNKTRTGAIGPHTNASKDFVDIDFPIFRLAEIYLIYAEATLRGGSGGNSTTALGYVNELRTRAYNGSTSGNLIPADLTLNFVLDERGRELFWEGHRRTDLIRYGLFTTGTYLWAWKGDVRNGTAVDSKYNLYPIPAIDLSANPNLVQNPGY